MDAPKGITIRRWGPSKWHVMIDDLIIYDFCTTEEQAKGWAKQLAEALPRAGYYLRG